jgi:hypothetical protein
MVLVYSEKVTNRVTYIFDLIFERLIGTDFSITTDPGEFSAHRGPKLSYGSEPLASEIFFNAHTLLFEKGIQSPELEFTEYKGHKVFFQVHHNDSVVPFDPFAASFYLVARYEEYLPYVRDEFGRFRAEKSMAFEHGLLKLPLVNIWAEMIAGFLNKRYKTFTREPNAYKFIPSIDVDAAYLYRSKGPVRTLGGAFLSLKSLNFREIGDRARVILGLEQDPFDTYAKQIELIKKHKLNLIYFILYAIYDINDKNLSVNNRKFQILIKTLADYTRVGIHSSYNSSYEGSKLRQEISKLSFVLKREITHARQHFIRLNIPETYRNYLSAGIREDFSMGYMHEPGFRAGICSPFPFYDLDMDHVTGLMVTPFSYAFTSTNGRDDKEKLQEVEEITSRVREYNGTMLIVWENAALRSDRGDWFRTFERVIEIAK